MNTLGLSTILRMGCLCTSESIDINGIKYIVKEVLGEGGFSCVELVEQASTKKKYALKRIKCHSIDDEKIANNEISYCKKLKHPNIIELIDACIQGSADSVVDSKSEAFLVLPYFKRGTLHDYLALKSLSKTYLDVREVIRLFHDICQGVKYMHDFTPEPVAHRDLKTGNVCLTDNMEPILMDLGSCAPAKVQICGSHDAQKLQDIAAERCSMTYRAPELFHVESYCVIDQRTDIWALTSNVEIVKSCQHVRSRACAECTKPNSSVILLRRHLGYVGLMGNCLYLTHFRMNLTGQINSYKPIYDHLVQVTLLGFVQVFRASLGCVLYALLYFKSPFDSVYERGDSVNLAVISGNVFLPEDTPFPKELHDLILFILKVNPAERPFIDDVIRKVNEFRRHLDTSV